MSDEAINSGERSIATLDKKIAPGLRKRLTVGSIGAYLVLIVFAIAYVWPMLTVVNTAFKPQPEFMMDPTALPQDIEGGLKNFERAWKRASFPTYMANSVLYTAAGTAVYLITMVFVAFPIARRYVKGSGFLFGLFIIALFLPPALIPQFQLLLHLGLTDNPVGYTLLFTTDATGMIILVNYLRSIPRDFDEAAAIDGCGYFRFVLQIALPLARPAIAAVTVLHAIGIWNELLLPGIYLHSKAYLPITRGLATFSGQYGNDWTGIAAGMLMMLLPMIILFVLLQKYIIGGVLQGAIRG